MSLQSSRPLARPAWQCTSCLLRRTFTTTKSIRAIAPESPRYIDIPQSLQPDRVTRPRVRGILPVPRKIFGNGAAKKEAIQRARTMTPSSFPSRDTSGHRHKVARQQQPKHAEIHAHKSRMAEMRKRNLTEGLQSLAARQVKADDLTRQRVLARTKERRALLNAPEREDERLTSPSVDPSVTAFLEKKSTGLLSDPDRETRLASMRERTAEHAAFRKQERTLALQTLYMNARDFIVDSASLDETVERVFGADERPVGFGQSGREESIWANGPQPSLLRLLKVSQMSDTNIASEVLQAKLTRRRLKIMAEELTGGKMDDPSAEDPQ